MPFSANSSNQRQLLLTYTYYRLVLSLTLLFSYWIIVTHRPAVHFDSVIYLTTAGAYSAFNFVTLVALLTHRLRINNYFLFFSFVVDIVALTLITHATRGISGSFSILLIVTVAAAGILITGTVAILIAAIATLAVLSEALLYSYYYETSGGDHLFQAGVLGIVFFISALLMQLLSRRIRINQELANQQAHELLDLQSLNNLIVERMRTGIIVATDQLVLRTMNDTALALLAMERPGPLPDTLIQQFLQWQANPELRLPVFQAGPDTPFIQANFTRLVTGNHSNIMIFLDDIRPITQHAQQLKLASLGQMAASIAHEIRNPLGAISHAAQLLRESSRLEDTDQRLIDIIQNHSRRMNEIIENVLGLSRRAAPNPHKFGLLDWLNEFAEEFGSQAKITSGQIQIQVVPEDLQIAVDSGQLRQVLSNLCQNGLRYARALADQPELTLHAYRHGKTGLPVLDVIDSGPGIEQKNRERIFEPFFTTETTGTGLGLYLARELCEANQTRLDYLITDQGASCFRLSFSHPDRRALKEPE